MPSTTQRAGSPAGGLRFFIRACLALAVAMISVPLLLSAPAAAVPAGHVVVCKYVSTPGPDEVASHIVMPSPESIAGDFDPEAGFPQDWTDAQNFSIAIRFTEEGEQTNDTSILEECPILNPTDECPELDGDQPPDFQCEPETETETRDLAPLLDCEAVTITTLHQERTRTEVFNEETGEFELIDNWTDWVTVDSDVVDATPEQCPPGEPIIDPPAPPAPPAETPTLPATGSSPYLSGLALMGALLLAAGSTLFMRSRKVRVSKA
jgi:LPXTG-motif cell wall-anchored protein